MLIRSTWILPVLLLVACVSPEEQASQQAALTAERAAWWPVQLADANQCRIQGFQDGTDAFAQCVTARIEEQSRPHRGAGRGWLILNKYLMRGEVKAVRFAGNRSGFYAPLATP
jgi:hypothetical protein